MKKIICISEGSDGVDFARLITNDFAKGGGRYEQSKQSALHLKNYKERQVRKNYVWKKSC